MFRRIRRRIKERNEQGATMVIMAFATVALAGLAGLAVDVGRLYSTRAELVKITDAGALAGVQNWTTPVHATNVAQSFALQNVKSGDVASTNITANQVGSDRKIQVTATRTVQTMFMKLLGISSVPVTVRATAGGGGILDVVMVLDTTYSMNGTPISNARQAAHDMVDQLLPDATGQTAIGITGFRSGYAPACTTPAFWGYQNCVPVSFNQALTGTASSIDATIDLYTADGNTNICTGLERGWTILDGPGKHTDPKTRRVIVLLSDGDNNPVGRSTSAWSAACDPGASHSSQGCSNTPTSVELALDTKLYNYAQNLKTTQNVEFYVVAFGVCGSIPANNATTYCDPAKVGASGYADSVHDRNMLKCIASSGSGTNDHYYEAATAADLAPLFQAVAAALQARLTE